LQDQNDTVQIAVGVLPTVSVDDPAAVAEGDSGSANTITFTVSLSAASNLPVAVPYSVAAGTSATGGAACGGGVDFITPTTSPLVIPATETQRTIVVQVCGDTVVEGNETPRIDLGTPTNAIIGDGQGQGTIQDDDAAGSLGFTAATAQVAENGGGVTLTGAAPASAPAAAGNVPSGSIRPGASPVPNVGPDTRLQPNALSAVAVSYATTNGTATAGQDYTTTSGTLSFGVGETTKTIVVPILSDAVDELPETFTVTLSAPTGSATLGTAAATVTITDVDTTPCQTTLSAAVPAGSNALPVVSQAGCNVGDTVAIDPGQPNEDLGTILGFGSIVVQQQTNHAHGPGAVVVRVVGGVPTVQISPGDESADDERVERERETEEERRQRARTNQGNKDGDAVEGDVVETRCDDLWPAVVIANRDGLVEVKLLKEAQKACRSISVGDYLEADGEKQHEQLFYADSVEVKRRG
jgi:hypothetical protein